ncbi:MAG: hypothetical protein CMJ19_22110 [Phycisphaeraceae bacterium]|nr:hypothetical protein [Phycisphaeraceae bacterium]
MRFSIVILMASLWLCPASAVKAQQVVYTWQASEMVASELLRTIDDQRMALLESGGELTLPFDAPAGGFTIQINARTASPDAASLTAKVDNRNVHTCKITDATQDKVLTFRYHSKWTREHKLFLKSDAPVYISQVKLIDHNQSPVVIQSFVMQPEPHVRSQITINPPTFRWYGKPGNDWQLQLCKVGHPLDQSPVIHTQSVFHRPTLPLEAGDWQWRYRQNDRDWSEPITFTVEASTSKWALQYPLTKQAFFSHLDQSHPRLILSPDRISKLRALMSTDLKTFADAWQLRLTEVCKEGIPYRDYQPDLPQGDGHLSHMGRRYVTKDFTAKLTAPIVQLAVAGVLFEREDFIANVITRADVAASLDPNGLTRASNVMFANSTILQGLGMTYDLLYDRLTEEQRALYRKQLLARLDIYKPYLETNVINAHAWQSVMYQATVAAMAIWDEEPKVHDWLLWAAQMFVAHYPWYGGVDGGSGEGYAYGVGLNVNYALPTVDLWATLADIHLDQHPWHANYPWSLIYAHPAGFDSPMLGDRHAGKHEPGARQAYLAMVLGKKYHNPYALAYAKSLNLSDEKLMDEDSGFWKGLAPITYLLNAPYPMDNLPSLADVPNAKHFRGVGEVYVQTEPADPKRNIRLEFRSSDYGSFAHAHADQNTFNLSAYGDHLLIDTGHYSAYGSDHHFGWTNQTKAHNNILIDTHGQEINRLDAIGKVTGFAQGDGYCWMRGDAVNAYFKTKLDQYNRQILWLDTGDIQTFIIVDDLKAASGNKHRYDWLLHFENQPTVDAKTQVITYQTPNAKMKVNWLTPTSFDEIIVSDQFDPPALYWKTKKPDKVKYPDQWHLSAITREGQQTMNYVTVIQVMPQSSKQSWMQPAMTDNVIRIGNSRVILDNDRWQIHRENQQPIVIDTQSK